MHQNLLTDQLRKTVSNWSSQPHRWACYLQDQLAILNRLEQAIADAPNDHPDIAYLEAQFRPAEYKALLANLQTELTVLEHQHKLDKAGWQTIDGRAFGLVGDSQHDDGPALRLAIQTLASKGPGTKLSLPAGRFLIADFPPGSMRTHWLIQGLTDVIIQGRGPMQTQIVGKQIGTVLRMEDCQRCQLIGIGIDHAPLPFTQGHLLECDEQSYTVIWQSESGWPTPIGFPFNLVSDPTVFARHINTSARDPQTNAAMHHGGFHVTKIDKLDKHTYRLHGWNNRTKSNHGPLPKGFEPGAPVVIYSRGIPGHQPAMWVSGNQYCELQNVAVYSSWDHAFLLTDNTSLKVLGCATHPMPQSGRRGSSNADGFHCRSNRIGPYFHQCEVHCCPDDCMNLYQRMVSVVDQPTPDSLLLDAPFDPSQRAAEWQPDGRAFAIGDQLAILNSMSGQIDACALITDKNEQPWRGTHRVHVRLDRSLSPLRTRETLGKRSPVASNQEFFIDDPLIPIEHMIINMQTKSDGFVVRDCHLASNSANGIKLKASNGIIDANHFDHNNMHSIILMMEVPWQEGYAPRAVHITNNHCTSQAGIDQQITFPGGEKQDLPPYINHILMTGKN